MDSGQKAFYSFGPGYLFDDNLNRLIVREVGKW